MCLVSTHSESHLGSAFRLDFELPRDVAGMDAADGKSVLAVVERRQWPRGKKLAHELRVYEEVSLTDMPLSMDLSQVLVVCAPKLPTVAAYDVAALLTGAGWQGPGLSFKLALSSMRASIAHVSKTEQELFVMTDGEMPPSCVLALNYTTMESTKPGPVPHIVAYPNKASQLYWELAGDGGIMTHVKELVFAKSVKVMRGESRFKAERKLQLLDPAGQISCREDLGGLQLLGYELDNNNYWSWPFLGVLAGEYATENEPQPNKGTGRSVFEKVKSSLHDLTASFKSMLRIGRRSRTQLADDRPAGMAVSCRLHKAASEELPREKRKDPQHHRRVSMSFKRMS